MTLITPFPIFYDFSKFRDGPFTARENSDFLGAQVHGLCAVVEVLDEHGLHVDRSSACRTYVSSGASDIVRGLYDMFIGMATMLGQEGRAVEFVERTDAKLQLYLRKRVDTPRSGSTSPDRVYP